MVTHNPNDPLDRRDRVRDDTARSSAKTATIIAAVAAVLALIALILFLVHNGSHDFAPANCDPATDYVCRPETVQETTTTDVPTTSMSPSSTDVPVPGTTQSEIVTTTVRP